MMPRDGCAREAEDPAMTVTWHQRCMMIDKLNEGVSTAGSVVSRGLDVHGCTVCDMPYVHDPCSEQL